MLQTFLPNTLTNSVIEIDCFTLKNVDLTVKIDYLLTYQIKNIKLTLCIESSYKKSRRSSLLPKN